MNWQPVIDQAMPLVAQLVVVVVGGVIVAAKLGVQKYLKAKVENQTLESALLYLNQTTWDVVAKAQQIAVGELKKDLADGKITKDELKASLAVLKEQVIGEIVELTWGKLQGALGLKDKAEAALIVEPKVEALIPEVKARAAGPTLASTVSAGG